MNYNPSPYQLPGLIRQAHRKDSPTFALVATIIVGYIIYSMVTDLSTALSNQRER